MYSDGLWFMTDRYLSGGLAEQLCFFSAGENRVSAAAVGLTFLPDCFIIYW